MRGICQLLETLAVLIDRVACPTALQSRPAIMVVLVLKAFSLLNRAGA